MHLYKFISMFKVNITANTILKERPYQSNNLLVGRTRSISKGTTLLVENVDEGVYSGHYELTLTNSEQWGSVAYIYHGHTDWSPDRNKLNPIKYSLSSKGVHLIKLFEGCELKPYICSGGVLTIGYGTTKNVHESMSITQEQADQLLKEDLQNYEAAVKRLVRVPITQSQYDSLTSFTYNLGPSALANSTLLKLLNGGDSDGNVSKQFLRWNKAGGKELKGLTYRRKSEAYLYLTGQLMDFRENEIRPIEI